MYKRHTYHPSLKDTITPAEYAKLSPSQQAYYRIEVANPSSDFRQMENHAIRPNYEGHQPGGSNTSGIYEQPQPPILE